MDRKYKFNWELLGDLKIGRPNLGDSTKVEVYRLFQYAFRDVMEQELGTEKTDELFFKAGKLAGEEFFLHYLQEESTDFNSFVKNLQDKLKEMGIGVLRIEKSAPESGEFTLTVSEDLDCSGLPELDYEICTYDEGFISGILEKFTGKAFSVKEIDCWCTGDRTCRFEAKIIDG